MDVNLPLKKAIIYRYATPNAKGEDITHIINNGFSLEIEDKLFLQFDLINQKDLEVFYQYFCLYTASDNISYVHFGTVKSLNQDFTINHTYNTVSNLSMNDVYEDNNTYIESKNFRVFTRSITDYGIMITGTNGKFNFISLDAMNDEYNISGTMSVTPTSLNLDDNPSFTVKFKAPKADNYIIKAYQNNILIGSKSGTKVYDDNNDVTAQFTSADLSYNSLSDIKFELAASYYTTSDTEKWSEYSTYFMSIKSYGSVVLTNLTCNKPTIESLEPNNVNQDKDVDIAISWVSTNQQEFSLSVDDKVYSGELVKSVVIPKGTFKTLKQISMTLTASRTAYGQTFTASRSSTFLLVGKPNTPIMPQHQYVSTAQPTFAWSCIDDYVQYRMIVVKYSDNSTVFDSGDTTSTATSCQCTTTLENNTKYTAKVKVKTQFGYWSDYGTVTFTTQYNVANKPSISVYTSENSIIINSSTVYSTEFSSCELYRKTEHSEWARIAFNLDNDFTYEDKFVGSETYYYKVSSVTSDYARNDSDVASAKVAINNFNFSNVENLDQSIELQGNPNIAITVNRKTATTEYSGVYAPVTDIGIQNYKSGSASFTVNQDSFNSLLNIIYNSKVLLYRDRRGEKFYCQVLGNITKTYIRGDRYSIKFNFVEVSFLEEDMYSGEGNLPVVFFNGVYKFDGTVTFNGEV